MATSSGTGAAPTATRRILVIANETCAGRRVVEEVRYRAGAGDAEALVIAPQLAESRLSHWLDGQSDERRAAAEQRLAQSVAALQAAGIRASGQIGDADPLQALDDAVRIFPPDEVVISTHPPSRSNWLEKRVVQRARERYRWPITHIVVDLLHEDPSSADHPDAPAPARPEPRAADPLIRLYHAAGYEEAMAIRRDGFPVDGGGVQFTDHGADDGQAIIFAVELAESQAAPYETAGAGPRREFVLPGMLLNRLGPPVTITDDWAE
jgi:hypothetical protein